MRQDGWTSSLFGTGPACRVERGITDKKTCFVVVVVGVGDGEAVKFVVTGVTEAWD